MARRTRNHGLALMLVIAVVAMASLIGMAMLSNASLQAQAAHNHEQAAAADYLAESAVQTAAYYLQRDLTGLPGSWSGHSGYTIFAEGVTVSGVSGSFDIKVTPTSATDVYDVLGKGYSSGTSPMTRTINTRMKVVRATPTYAGGFGGASVINLQNYFTGAPVAAVGTLSGGGLVNLLGGSRSVQSNDFSVPSVGTGQINYYGADVANGTYLTPSGQVGTAQILASGAIASPATLTALATNPGKIFYYSGNVSISGAGNYTGTIISRGRIEINPPLGSSVTWNRQPGFPAMMSDGSIYINTRSSTVNINGVVFAGGGTGFNSLLTVSGTHIRVNGAMLIPAGKNMLAGGLGSMTVTYTPTNVDVQNMTTVAQPPVALKYLSWDQ